MFQFSFHTSDFGFYINHVAQWHSVFGSSYHEGRSAFRLALYHCNGRKVTHLLDHRIELCNRIFAQHLQVKRFFLSYVLLQTDAADITDNSLDNFKLCNECGVYISIHAQCTYHQTFSFFRITFVHLLPQFFCDERHKRMKQMQQVIEEAESSAISGTVNSLSVSRFNHFQIPGREFIPE